MSDDALLRQVLKQWAGKQRTPSGGRARLLEMAAVPQVLKPLKISWFELQPVRGQEKLYYSWAFDYLFLAGRPGANLIT